MEPSDGIITDQGPALAVSAGAVRVQWDPRACGNTSVLALRFKTTRRSETSACVRWDRHETGGWRSDDCLRLTTTDGWLTCRCRPWGIFSVVSAGVEEVPSTSQVYVMAATGVVLALATLLMAVAVRCKTPPGQPVSSWIEARFLIQHLLAWTALLVLHVAQRLFIPQLLHLILRRYFLVSFHGKWRNRF